MIRTLCCFFILISFLSFTSAEISAQDNFNIECISQSYYNWMDGVIDVAVQGDYAYLACQEDGLRIVDISNIHSPTEIGHFRNGSWIQRIAVSGDYLYTPIDFDASIGVLDISDPVNPVFADTIALEGYVRELSIIDGMLYAGCGGYAIIDISDPLDAEVVFRSEPVSDVLDFERKGDVLYLASEWHGLNVIDISDLDNPDTLGVYSADNYNYVNGLAVKDGYAYLAHGWQGLIVVDLETMEQVARIDSLVYAFDAKIVDGLLYINYGDPDCPLAIINIDDPHNPQTLGVYYPPEELWNFEIIDNIAYVADMNHGLRMVDVSDPTTPAEISNLNHFGDIFDVKVKGDYAYVREEVKITVFDISDPSEPQEAAVHEPVWGYRDFMIIDDYMLLLRCGYECLLTMDISDPLNPSIISSFTTDDCDVHYRFIRHDHYLYVVENHGLRILDISDPANVEQAGFLSLDAGNSMIHIEGDLLFLQETYRHVNVFDISDPVTPVQVGTWNTGHHCNDIASYGNHVFVAIGSEIRVYDSRLLSRTDPVDQISLLEPFGYGVHQMDVIGDLLYITMNYGIAVMNIADIENPFLVACHDTPGNASGFTVDDHLIYVADYDNFGIYNCAVITDVTPAGPTQIVSSFNLLSNYPNPFNSTTQIRFEVAGQYHVSLAIYDMLGRQVTTLTNQNFTTGTHVIPWNGTNSAGSAVASGKYFVRARANDDVSTIPIVLLK